MNIGLKCIICGQLFNSRVKTAKCCSKKCGDKSYNLRNSDKIKSHLLKNKDKIKKQRAEYYQKNIEHERENCRKWYANHKESEIEKNSQYRKEKKELFDWYHNKDRFNGMKNIILDRDNHKCCICGSKKLVVHHIDGTGYTTRLRLNLKESNNNIENLITLCPSCHHILHRWQLKNKHLKTREDIVRTMVKVIEARK